MSLSSTPLGVPGMQYLPNAARGGIFNSIFNSFDGLPRPGLAEFMSWWWLIYKFILDFISCLSKFGLGFTRRRISVYEYLWKNLNFIAIEI